MTPGLPAGTVTPPVSINATSAAFVTKISAAGDRILYSARISGHQKNCGAGSSCFLSSRYTMAPPLQWTPRATLISPGTPTPPTCQPPTGALLAQGTGAFVAKVNSAGTALVYLTYLGPGYQPVSQYQPRKYRDRHRRRCGGNAYVTGSTFDDAFPGDPPAPGKRRAKGGTDAFAAKLNPQGSAVVWATYLGGKGADVANAIALDAAGNVWLAGTNGSPDFPNQIGWSQGGDFLTGLNAAGSTLIYSSRLPDDTAAASLAVDAAGVAHLAGYGGRFRRSRPRRVGVGVRASSGSPTLRSARPAGASWRGRYSRSTGRVWAPTPVTAVPDASGMMPRLLGGVQVSINGSPVPLLYVSDTQMNAVTPLFLSGATARVRVSFNGVDTADFVATVVAALPEIFQRCRRHGRSCQSGWQHQLARIIRHNPEHRCHLGHGNRVNTVWLRWLDGQIAPRAYGLRLLPDFRANSANVLYGGAAPGIVAGVAQVNFGGAPNAVDLLRPHTLRLAHDGRCHFAPCADLRGGA